MITEDRLRAMTDEQWAQAWPLMSAEAMRRTTMATARATAEQAAADYAAAVIVPDTVPDVSDMDTTAVIGPGEHLTVRGVEWVNASGAWLSPHTAGPADYPTGWRHAAPEDVATADPWAPSTKYEADALVTHSGQTYRCIQPHTSQTGWEPPDTPALWTLA
ncbi:carbohydrate-binding protein [Actinomyces faecalis]|uniref:carbohydrate-binding protein n=1 Tax=Actinomyces faecalis TaxID=2722820 RepID=UPI001C553A6C|nr:carbohydrate-binding protein [Actinomyces faecalis]